MLLLTQRGKEIQQAICKAIENGNTLDIAASLAGIGISTLHAWRKTGREARLRSEEGDELSEEHRACMEFLEATEKAESEAISRNVMLIQTAAIDSWQAAAWYLERRRPEQWGRQSISEQVIAQMEAEMGVLMRRFALEVLAYVKDPEERQAILGRYQRIGRGDVLDVSPGGQSDDRSGESG